MTNIFRKKKSGVAVEGVVKILFEDGKYEEALAENGRIIFCKNYVTILVAGGLCTSIPIQQIRKVEFTKKRK